MKRLTMGTFWWLLFHHYSTSAYGENSQTEKNDGEEQLLLACKFPTPGDSPAVFRERCQNEYTHLDFVCDYDAVGLSHTGAERIRKKFVRYRDVFQPYGDKVRLAVVLLKHLGHPTDLQQWELVFGAGDAGDTDCAISRTQLRQYRNQPQISDKQLYRKLFVGELQRRWFAQSPNDTPCDKHTFILVILPGSASSAAKADRPYVSICSGETDSQGVWLSQLERTAMSNMTDRSIPLPNIIANLISEIGLRIRSVRANSGKGGPGGRRRIIHVVPDWALSVFCVCAGLVVVAMLAEWCVVRRKAAGMRAGAPGARVDNGHVTKSHMMFG